MLAKFGIYRIYLNILSPNFLDNNAIKVYAVTMTELHMIEVPQAMGNAKNFWDLGFISAPYDDFVEINCITDESITRDLYLKEYQSLIKFLGNSKSIDLKNILGFNHKDRIDVKGDTMIQKNRILSSLENYNFDPKNIDHLIASANKNGLYSFQKLKQKLERIKPEIQFYGGALHDDDDDDEEDYEKF